LVILLVSSLGSQIEAPIAASKINREARKTALSQVRLTVATVSF
jgi:Na+/phosphate symporter